MSAVTTEYYRIYYRFHGSPGVGVSTQFYVREANAKKVAEKRFGHLLGVEWKVSTSNPWPEE